MNSEAHLIQAARAGDQHAMSELYQQHVNAVYRYVFARVNQVALAEDITSDVFVRALESLPTYQERGVPFVGWLYHIAYGRVVDYYRRAGRRAHDQVLEEMTLAAEDDPEAEVVEQSHYAQMLASLDQLTEEQQQVLMMRFMQEQSIEKTAQVMGKTEGAIKALQFRAIQALARLMKVQAHD